MPQARIHVVAKNVEVLRTRIYPELVSMLPDIGMCGGGKHNTPAHHRIMLFTADSLHHSDGKADIMIGDESHQLCADRAAARLAIYDDSRNYGLSATHDMRLDGKDMRAEAIFGPILHTITYQEAQAHQMVVPIEVHWSDVHMDRDPAEDIEDPVKRKKICYWRNDTRNQIIADRVRTFGPDVQVLITTEVIEHALALKQLLPEYELVYSENGIDPGSKLYFVNQGLMSRDDEPLTLERRRRITQDFERGTCKKVICTTVFNVGVSFNHLAVLCRADGGGSPVGDTQIPGRASRIDEGKEKALILDFKDQFSQGCKVRAGKRRNNYLQHGWVQVDPVDTLAHVPPQHRLNR